MKRLGILLVTIAVSIAAPGADENRIQNLLAAPPYNDAEMGKKLLVDQAYLFMIQVALKPGQAVPQHNANSHVNILVLDGEIVFDLAGKVLQAKKGDLVPIAFKTPMSIKNDSKEKATFVIIKTPNPSQMEKQMTQ
jgi:quercetin dioxygenase-like cupin family protein